MGTNRLVVIGLDSMDKDLVAGWAGEGVLPRFRALMSGAVRGVITNPRGLEAGACWPSFYRGASPAVTGQYDGARHFDPATYRDDCYAAGAAACDPIWRTLGRAGKRCIVIDAPYALLTEDENCTYVIDRAAHVPAEGGDMMSFRTSPPALARELEARYGADPAGGLSSDQFPLETLEEVRRFTDLYVARIGVKADMVVDMMAERDWDFLFPVFTEAHCFGHRCWHLHDPAHPDHRADLAAAAGDPLRRAYQALDAAVGRILDAAGAETRALVYLSHGMGPRRSGTRLLDRVLVRLEGGRPRDNAGAAMRTVRQLWRRLPPGLKSRLAPLRKSITNDGLQPNRAGRRFFEVYANDRTAGIRLNVVGRERDGVVAPGPDYDACCDALTTDLRALVNDETGEPLVAEVLKTRDHYAGPELDRLPDLLVTWNRSAPIRAIRSDKVGLVDDRGLYNPRAGDHRPDGYFFATGPGWAPRLLNAPVPVEAFAPTLARLFGLEAREAGLSGAPLTALTP